MKMGPGSVILFVPGSQVEAVVGFGAPSPKRRWSDLGSTHVEPVPVAPAPHGEHEEETASTPEVSPPARTHHGDPRHGLYPRLLRRVRRAQEDRRRLRPPRR